MMQKLISTAMIQSTESMARKCRGGFSIKKRHSMIAAVLFSSALTALAAQPAYATTVDLYGSYTDGVSGVTSGDNAPTISTFGGLQSTDYFHVDNLVYGGIAARLMRAGGG